MNVLEKILEEIDNYAIEFELFGMCDDYVSVGRVKEIIRSHMNDGKNANVISNDGWIPCEERLPEVPEENPLFDNKPLELYLVDIGIKYPIRAFWNGREFTDGWSILKVIAWQPLPKSYKPEEKARKHKNAQQEIEDFWNNK